MIYSEQSRSKMDWMMTRRTIGVPLFRKPPFPFGLVGNYENQPGDALENIVGHLQIVAGKNWMYTCSCSSTNARYSCPAKSRCTYTTDPGKPATCWIRIWIVSPQMIQCNARKKITNRPTIFWINYNNSPTWTNPFGIYPTNQNTCQQHWN